MTQRSGSQYRQDPGGHAQTPSLANSKRSTFPRLRALRDRLSIFSIGRASGGPVGRCTSDGGEGGEGGGVGRNLGVTYTASGPPVPPPRSPVVQPGSPAVEDVFEIGGAARVRKRQRPAVSPGGRPPPQLDVPARRSLVPSASTSRQVDPNIPPRQTSFFDNLNDRESVINSFEVPLSPSSRTSSPPPTSLPSPDIFPVPPTCKTPQYHAELAEDVATGDVESPRQTLRALEGGRVDSSPNVEQHPIEAPEDDGVPGTDLSDQPDEPLHSQPSPTLASSADKALPHVQSLSLSPFPSSPITSTGIFPSPAVKTPRRPLIPAFELTPAEQRSLDEMEKAVALMREELFLGGAHQATGGEKASGSAKSRFMSLPNRHSRLRKASQPARGPASRARELLETLLPRRNHLFLRSDALSPPPETTRPNPPPEQTPQDSSYRPPTTVISPQDDKPEILDSIGLYKTRSPSSALSRRAPPSSSPTRSTLFSRQSDNTSFDSLADKSGTDSVQSDVRRHTLAAPARRKRPGHVFSPDVRESPSRQGHAKTFLDSRRSQNPPIGTSAVQPSRVWSLRGASSTLSRDGTRPPSRTPLLARSSSRASVTLRSGAGRDWVRENERRWLGDEDGPTTPSTSTSPAFQASRMPAYPRSTMGRSSMKTISLRSHRSNVEHDDSSPSASRLRLRGKSSSTNNWYPSTPERFTHLPASKDAKVSFAEVLDRDEDAGTGTSSISKVHAMDKLEIFFLYAAIKTDLARVALERDALAVTLKASRAELSGVQAERDAFATNLREERTASRRINKFRFPPPDPKPPYSNASSEALLLSRQSWEKRARDTLADAESAHDQVEALRVVVAEGRGREAQLRRELEHQWEKVAAHIGI